MLDPTSDKASVTLYLVRHGEVHNPEAVIYGHLPGFGLSERGRGQIARAAELLAKHGPFSALYASPLQRAQESAGLLAEPLGFASSVACPEASQYRKSTRPSFSS